MFNTRRTSTSAAIAAAALGFGLLLTGCASNSTDSGDAGFVGTWGDTSASSSPSLVIEEGGSFSGTDGCNSLTGQYEVSGDTIDFGSVATTLMACEGVDTWLNGLSTGKVSGDSLEISDADGNVIGSLARA